MKIVSLCPSSSSAGMHIKLARHRVPAAKILLITYARVSQKVFDYRMSTMLGRQQWSPLQITKVHAASGTQKSGLWASGRWRHKLQVKGKTHGALSLSSGRKWQIPVSERCKHPVSSLVEKVPRGEGHDAWALLERGIQADKGCSEKTSTCSPSHPRFQVSTRSDVCRVLFPELCQSPWKRTDQQSWLTRTREQMIF